jgi:hypothetical protein
MPTPFESAQLNLQLFALRRDPTLRDARHWFLHELNPDSFEELLASVTPERETFFRMVVGYWEMAASMVTGGAIDGDAFRAAHGEVFATFAKLYPFLPAIREYLHEPSFWKHLETVIFGAPDAQAIVERRLQAMRGAKARGTAAT